MTSFRAFCAQPVASDRVGDQLIAALTGDFEVAHLSVGFVQASGVRYLAPHLEGFRRGGGEVRALVGVDGRVTTAPGVAALRARVDRLWLFRQPGALFHPKTFVFAGPSSARILVGSANLTRNGLWVNHEDLIALDLDLREARDRHVLDAALESFGRRIASPNAVEADDGLIAALIRGGLLPPESGSLEVERAQERPTNVAARQLDFRLFPPSPVLPPPPTPLLPEEVADRAAPPRPARQPSVPGRRRRGSAALPDVLLSAVPSPHSSFVMRLNNQDANHRPGHPADVYIPLRIYRYDPEFWGRGFRRRGAASGRQRRIAIQLHHRDGTVERARRRMYHWPAKHELRLNMGKMQREAATGDLLVLDVAAPGLGVEFVARLVKPSDATYSAMLAFAVNQIPRSPKRWGYA